MERGRINLGLTQTYLQRGPALRSLCSCLRQEATLAEPGQRLCLFAELSISKKRSCRDHSLGESPAICWPKPGQLYPVTSWLPWALGHWPPALGQAPSHAREPSHAGMERPVPFPQAFRAEMGAEPRRSDVSILRTAFQTTPHSRAHAPPTGKARFHIQ